MKVSCGFVIMNVDKKVLIAHPTNDFAGYGIWTFPKGEICEKETHLECALRETFEETNLDLKALQGEISYLGTTIRNNRQVILYLFKSSEDLKKYDIKCVSMVEGDDEWDTFPEMDAFKWVTLEQSYGFLSNREQEMVEELVIYNPVIG
jgi:8-oxo-dGTP pyrophosphatase MutT (NUDIX family)